MFKFIEFLKKRPSDKTIRLIKILMGLLIIALLWIYFEDFSLPIAGKYEIYAKYSIFILGIMPLLGGITGLCIAKRKIVRIMQLIMGILFIVVGNLITIKSLEAPVISAKPITTSWALDYNAIAAEKKTTPSKPLNIGTIIAWLSIFPLFWAATGKCITEKCLKHGEVIKKIRV